MFACEKALIELTKSYVPELLLLTYQLSAAVLQVTLAAREKRKGCHSRSNTTNGGPSTQWASDGAWNPWHTTHHMPGEACPALGSSHSK